MEQIKTNSINIEEAKQMLQGAGKKDYTKYNKEYVYHDVPHRFIAEKYMEDESGFELKDYKIFCFDGSPKYLFVATGRQQHDTRFDFYDLEFNHLPVLNGHPNADKLPAKPDNFEEMLEVASKLSKGIPFVRIDFFYVEGKVYFGECTFYDWAGMRPFTDYNWDLQLGSWIDLSIIKK